MDRPAGTGAGGTIRVRGLVRAVGPQGRRGRETGPMFRHIVLLTLRDDATDDARDEIVDRLRELPGRIDSIRRYEVALDLGLSEGNATVAVVADFDDRAGWEEYRDHPDHVAVIEGSIRPVLAARTATQILRPSGGTSRVSVA